MFNTNNDSEKPNEQQLKAITAPEGPLLVLAGAGTGKTKTIIHRITNFIQERNIPSSKILAVTFTNKAANELAERISYFNQSTNSLPSSPVLVKTFHSLGLYFLRRFIEYLNYPSNFTIWDNSDQKICIQNILNNHFQQTFNKTNVTYFMNQIGTFKEKNISPEELSEKVDLDQMEFGELLENFYILYEKKKEDSYALDFGDLLFKTVQILQKHPQTLEIIHQQYTHFFVDEYQDTNYIQYLFIQLISENTKNLCVVGDDDQSIYSWRGANIQNILNFQRDYPNATVIKLEENYRSHQNILKISNSVIQHNTQRMEKVLFTQQVSHILPDLHVFSNDKSEAQFVASSIVKSQNTNPEQKIAILYRTNIQSRLLEEQLLQKKVAYKIYGSVSFFERKEVKDAFAYLQFIVNPSNEVAFFRIINTPTRGVGTKSIQVIYEFHIQQQQENPQHTFLDTLKNIDNIPIPTKAKAGSLQLFSWLETLCKKIKSPVNLSILLDDILEQSTLKQAYEEEDCQLSTNRMEHIQELKSTMIDFMHENPNALLAEYLEKYTLQRDLSHNQGEQKQNVHLMTIHNAKGLEFDRLYLIGLDDGILPHFLCKDSLDSLEEERRLFYVAITRAKIDLIMTRATARLRQGWMQVTSPSSFLSEIPKDYLKIHQYKEEKSSFSSNKYPKQKPYSTNKFPNMYSKKSSSQIASTSALYQQGEMVSHEQFGVGKITNIQGDGKSTMVTIKFSRSLVKKFMLDFVKLKKIS